MIPDFQSLATALSPADRITTHLNLANGHLKVAEYRRVRKDYTSALENVRLANDHLARASVLAAEIQEKGGAA